MRRLFGTIAADRHAAPSSRPSPGMIGKHQRAGMPLARFHGGEVYLAHELRQCFADRQQQRFGRSPTSHQLQLQAIAVAMALPRYLAERFVAFQKPVQRTELAKRLWRERAPHVLLDKASEPFAQITSLVGHLVQFTWHRSLLHGVQRICWNKLGLIQPLEETIAALEPVDRSVDRRRDGIQKIEAERVGDESSGRSVLHDWPPSKQEKGSNRITCQTPIDKLCNADNNLSRSCL